ncbi:MAG: helix-turn-helix domain-containing protein [Chloroflexota bacterium]
MGYTEKPLAYVTLELVSDKWAILVVYHLADTTYRYNQLKREIEGISAKMLTQTLRNLETNGLVHREVYPTMPPKVEYSLTELGKTLVPPLKSLCKWAYDHLEDVLEARETHADKA